MMMNLRPTILLLACCMLSSAVAFTPAKQHNIHILSNNIIQSKQQTTFATVLLSTPNNDNNDALAQKFGGYTTKQRLREEVESPFRKVRLGFFGASAASAALALYFSLTVALKAKIGGYENVIPLDEALVQVAINAAGALGFAALTVRELDVGKKNLERIAKGGLLARLVVQPAMEESSKKTLKEYRREKRVVIAAGGKDYINRLAMSLCSDQLADENTLPQSLAGVDVVIVPVLLNNDFKAVETMTAWTNAEPSDTDRNFDSTRANQVVAFPAEFTNWNEYLKSDVETAKGQGFDVLEKGITITVKKNGRILRRATGLPPFGDFIGAMEVADGSRFGMPGDSEKYGGP